MLTVIQSLPTIFFITPLQNHCLVSKLLMRSVGYSSAEMPGLAVIPGIAGRDGDVVGDPLLSHNTPGFAGGIMTLSSLSEKRKTVYDDAVVNR